MLPLNDSTAAELLDRIVAIVDEDVITQVELESRIGDFMHQLRKPVTTEQDRQALQKQVLEKMVRDKIQLQMAERLGIKIDDVSLNRTLERLAQSNNISLQQLRRTLDSEGIKFERFREQTRNELIMKQLQQRMVANKVTVSDQEIDQLIADNRKQSEAATRYKLRHILINTPGTASPEQVQQAKTRVDAIYQRAMSGEDFADLAVQESAGRNALNGGELGWRASNELPESFVAALRKIDKGEVTTPIRSASGFHLLYIVDSSRQDSTVIQTLARHILVRTDDTEAALDQLNRLRQRIEQGEDFASLAKQYSDDTGSKSNGGELGWADPGAFVPEFESTMMKLDKGEISEPFSSQFGWHIMQVLDRRESTANRDALAKAAMKQIRARKTEEELRLWLQQIRDEAYVQYIDGITSAN